MLFSTRFSPSKFGRETRLPAARWSIALGFVFLLAACGNQAADGPVIGVRPNAEVNVGAVSFDASPIADAFAAQLAATNSIQSIGETTLANGELPLDSVLTLRQSLRLAYEQVLDNTFISDRLNAISTVRGQVLSDRSTASWQKARVLGVLDGASAALYKLRLKVAREQLVDAAAHDKFYVFKLRVLTVVLPQARLLMAAYQLDNLASFYARQTAGLQQAIYAWEANGNDGTAAQAALNDFVRRIAITRGYSGAAVAQVSGLGASGYPGNRSSLISARGSLVAGKVAGDQAAADAVRTRAALR